MILQINLLEGIRAVDNGRASLADTQIQTVAHCGVLQLCEHPVCQAGAAAVNRFNDISSL